MDACNGPSVSEEIKRKFLHGQNKILISADHYQVRYSNFESQFFEFKLETSKTEVKLFVEEKR